MLFIEIII